MIVSTLVMTVSPFALTQRPRSSPVHGSDWTELQRFSVWLTRLASAAHDAYSERLRQAFMKPWFVWVNIIAIRYRTGRFKSSPPSCRLRYVCHARREVESTALLHRAHLHEALAPGV